MADYAKIVRRRPEVREFIRHRRWVHRGEALAYGPNFAGDGFSTDAVGFRQTTFRGRTLSTSDAAASERFGLVLGASNIYGFGCAGNENTMPSLLAAKFGFPFANIGLPEGNSRNLFTILLRMIRSRRRPAVVIHLSGGDFTGFCYSGIADPAFGFPNLYQVGQSVAERGGRPPIVQQAKNLYAFSALWSSTIADLCRAARVPLLFGDDTTFFEKAGRSDYDVDCKLGIASSPDQQVQFDVHHAHGNGFYLNRERLADKMGIPIAGLGRHNDIGFIDEFHYDANGTGDLTEEIAKGLEPLLK